METPGHSCHPSASPAPAFTWRGGHLQQVITANCSYSHIFLAGVAELKEQSEGLPTPCFGKELASTSMPEHATGEGLLIPWQDSIAQVIS